MPLLSTGDPVQILVDRLHIEATGGQTDVTIRTHQNHSISPDAIEMGGVAIDVKQSVIRGNQDVASTRDGIRMYDIFVAIRELWRGLISKRKQCEMRPTKQLEESGPPSQPTR